MDIHIYDRDDVWSQASGLLINDLEMDFIFSKKILLLLSGGSSVNLYKDLANFLKKQKFNHSLLALAQVDERFQPENKKDINAYQIEKTGLWEMCKKKEITYDAISQEGTLEQSSEQYNQTISKLFKEYTCRMAVLGIGEDGHTAGLLPGYEKLWNTQKYVVGYKLRQISPRGAICRRGFPFRISLTPKALRQLDYVIIIAVGEKKKEALARINDMKIKDMDKYPGILLRKIKKVDLFTDVEV